MPALSVRRPPAQITDTGAAYTTAVVPNPVAGIEEGSPATMTLPTFEQASQPLYAWRMTGDAAPRVVMCTNPWFGLYLGDGVDDPVNDASEAQACNIYYSPGNGFFVDVYDDGQITLRAPDGVRIPEGPLRLASPDESTHTVAVTDAGALTVDGVPVGGGGGATYLDTFKWGVD